MTNYSKRLIEADLPIKRISAQAWRPLAACRAIICAALWPDPADPLCPPAFVTKALAEMQKWTARDRQAMLSAEGRERFEKARQKPVFFKDAEENVEASRKNTQRGFFAVFNGMVAGLT